MSIAEDIKAKEAEEEKIYKKLGKKLNPTFILTRRHDGMKYIAGYIAIENANRIFGFKNWGYKIIEKPTLVKEIEIKTQKPAWFYTCSVESWVLIGEKKTRREDVGLKAVTFTKATQKPQLEVAYKSCVTDALKRALRAWGNQFGNSLYDREQKLSAIQSEITTAEETNLKNYVQKLLNCKTEKELEKELDGLVQIAKQDEWKESQVGYIKNVAERVRKGIETKLARRKARNGKSPKSTN